MKFNSQQTLLYFLLLNVLSYSVLQSCTSSSLNTVIVSDSEIKSVDIIKANLGNKEFPISGKFITTHDPVTGLLSIKFNKVYLDEYVTPPVNKNNLTGKFFKIYLKQSNIINNKQELVTQTFNPDYNGASWYIFEQIIGLPLPLKNFSLVTTQSNELKNRTNVTFSSTWPKNSNYNTQQFSTLFDKYNFKKGAVLNDGNNFHGLAHLKQRCFGNLQTGPIKETRLSVKNYTVEGSDGKFINIEGQYLLKKTVLTPPVYFYRVIDVYYSSFFNQAAQEKGEVTFILECITTSNIISKAVIIKKQKIY